MRLIKTAIDIVDLDKNQDCIVLGDWCLNGLEDVLGSDNNYNKVPYHWDNREKFNQDYYYLSNLYERTLKEFSENLNVIHDLNADIRYWRIIIGPWLRFFIDSVFDRYEIIRTATKNKEYLEIRTFAYNLEDWIPRDFNQFYDDFRDDQWNEVIFSECLRSLKIDTLAYDQNLTRISKGKSQNFIKKIISLVLTIYEYFLPKLFNKIIVVEAYASIKVILKLHLKLKQFPYFNTISVDDTEIDFKKRESFSLSDPKNHFEVLLSSLLGKHIPKVYVEGYKDFRQKTLERYPKDPKVIFTSNAYQANEEFKFLAAEKTASKSKLVIGQHGGHFGIGLHNQTEDHQLKISDQFISWGWTSSRKDNIVPLPALKLNIDRKIKHNGNGKVLHVLAALPRYFYCNYSVPLAGQFKEYLQDQLDFLHFLEADSADNTKIRLDGSGNHLGWNIEEIFKEYGYGSNLTKSDIKFLDQLSDSRLCVYTHNATIFLETLSLNFPTIIFWNKNHYEIRPESQDYINSLEEVGILHFSAESAANQVNRVFDNVEGWWSNPRLQEVREKFVKNYALSKENPITDWVNLFKEMKHK